MSSAFHSNAIGISLYALAEAAFFPKEDILNLFPQGGPMGSDQATRTYHLKHSHQPTLQLISSLANNIVSADPDYQMMHPVVHQQNPLSLNLH